jgi:hypothetical protein
MTPEQIIQTLLAAAAEPAERIAAREAWVRRTAAAWREAQREMDERCGVAVARLSEEEFERLFDAEQAKVDAIRAEIDDVIEHDRWPKHLYWSF